MASYLSDSEADIKMLANPMLMQSKVLEDIESRWEGEIVLVDQNSVWANTVDAFSSMSSTCLRSLDGLRPAFYAKRAVLPNELYRHMSDFDYVNMFSTPAQATMVLQFDRQYLIDNAKSFNDNYKKVVIPKNTVFTVGKYRFGIYYPIEIKINKSTNSFLITHDTEVENPLYSLTSNTVEKVEWEVNGLKLLAIQVPAHQFERTVYNEDIVPSLAFCKKYKYTDKLYAVRVYHWKDNKWNEFGQTLSDVYEAAVPTARIMVFPDTSEMKIIVPQIYFSQGRVGSKMKIEVFTTYGALDSNISQIPEDAIFANYALDDDETTDFSSVLASLPTNALYPKDTKVVGGSNGYGMDELKTRVVNNSFYTDVLITPTDVEKYFQDIGFKVLRHLDNITNRIYLCYKALTDGEGSTVSAADISTKFDSASFETVSSIVKNLDGTFTVLPSTLYNYDDSGLVCIPMADTERLALERKDRENKILHYNNNVITRSPFHMLINMSDRYPKAHSFNLMDTKVRGILFKKANVQITSQMLTTSAVLKHLNQGTGGYALQFSVSKSKDIAAGVVAEADLVVYLMTKTTQGVYVGARATKIGSINSDDVYELQLPTNYHLTKDGTLHFTSLTNDNNADTPAIYLNTTFEVVFMLNRTIAGNYPVDPELLVGVPDAYTGQYVPMVRQSIDVEFGHSLDDVVYNLLDAKWTKQEYARYPITEYRTYPEDVFARDANGKLIYDIVDGVPQLQILHKAGDTVLDDFGNPVPLHLEGDVILDSSGSPVISKQRSLVYRINMLHVDAKIFMSEHPTQLNYVNSMTQQLESYFTVLKSAPAQVREDMFLYYRPIRSLGSAVFNLGDDVTTRQSLQLEFKIKCYVPDFVVADESLVTMVEKTATSIIESTIGQNNVSMTHIANLIMAKMPDYVKSVDVLGINGSITMQTIMVQDKDTQPSLAKELYLTKAGVVQIRPKLSIEIVRSPS